MLQLYIDDRLLELLPGATLSFEINNPIFFYDDIIPGSFSYPFTIPLTPENLVTLGFPDVLESIAEVRRDFPCLLVADGVQISGVLKLRKVQGRKATANMQVGISALVATLKNREIGSFEYGGTRNMGATDFDVTQHMNGTVADPENSDYIFAPFRYNARYGQPVIDELLGELNFYTNDYYKTMAGAGTFMANSYFDIFGSRGGTYRNIMPLPWLKYVLLQIFEELDVKLQESFFDAELSKLVIMGNVLLDEKEQYIEWDQSVVEHNPFRKEFTIGELLPKITVVDLLKKLAVTFGLTTQVTLKNEVIIQKLYDVIESADYIDMTSKVGSTPEIEIEEKAGLTLAYYLDSADHEAGEKIKSIEPALLKAPVATLADLQQVTGMKSNHIRFVEELNQYYFYYLDAEVKEWRFYSENYVPFPVDGGGYEVPQGIATTLVKTLDKFGLEWKIPMLGIPSFSPAFGQFNETAELRLLFYRGLQPWISANDPGSYPMISDDNFNALGQQVGDYSLRLEGEHGTYEKFLKPWLDFKVNHKPVKVPVMLDMVDLANLNLNKKWDIAGNRFLVKKLNLTLPLRKSAVAELWKCKK